VKATLTDLLSTVYINDVLASLQAWTNESVLQETSDIHMQEGGNLVMAKILFRNVKAIVTCDPDDSVYYDADMLVDGPAIIKIGRNIPSEGALVIDGHDKFMYPGLINTHHHFFQAFVRNLITIDRPNMTVMQWLAKAQETFQMVNSDVIYYASLTAMADLIKHGCTTAFDHQYMDNDDSESCPIDRQFEAAQLLGMRFHAGRGGSTRSIAEGSFVPECMCETTDSFLSDCDRLISKFHDSGKYSMRQIVIAPTQPFSCKEETFIESARLARRRKVRLHTHLNEGEVSQMISRTGMRTLKWAEKTGFIGPDVWIAHGRETTPEEYHVLAEYGTGIAHCPAPTFYGATEMLNIPAMKKAGIIISLGTDGCSTNEGSNMLETVRLAYLMQTFRNKDKTGCPSPYEILKMATVNGAKVLGRTDIGYLKEGMAADLFLIDIGTLEYAGALHDPMNIIPKLGVAGPVWMTMINGRIVFQDGKLPGIDERKLAKEGEGVCTRVLRNHCDVFSQLKSVLSVYSR
jgi:hydroxyatrazine ethylaminohydrolase